MSASSPPSERSRWYLRFFSFLCFFAPLWCAAAAAAAAAGLGRFFAASYVGNSASASLPSKTPCSMHHTRAMGDSAPFSS